VHEIERKFLLLLPAAEIERQAAAAGTLRSRRLIQQRYLPPRGWRLRAKRVPTANGERRIVSLKRAADGARLDFDVNEEAWGRLRQVARPGMPKKGDPNGTERLRIDDLSTWTVRLRRSSAISGCAVVCEFTMKQGISMERCIEIESPVPEGQHDAAKPYCGPAIRKRRTKIDHAGRCWEVDSFANPELAGIEFVEVEIPCETTRLSHPSWVGPEVTQDKTYKNARLVKRVVA
jgi:CYTH domain-containing protein